MVPQTNCHAEEEEEEEEKEEDDDDDDDEEEEEEEEEEETERYCCYRETALMHEEMSIWHSDKEAADTPTPCTKK